MFEHTKSIFALIGLACVTTTSLLILFAALRTVSDRIQHSEGDSELDS